jgi:hypothetical protein
MLEMISHLNIVLGAEFCLIGTCPCQRAKKTLDKGNKTE